MKRWPPVIGIGVGAVVLGVFAAATQAGVIAYQVPPGTPGNQAFGGPLGMEFNVNHTIVVTELGVFDDGSNGLSLDLGASLWDRTSTGAPIESLSFPGSDPGMLVGGSRFKPLATPRILTPGFQGTIVAEGYGAGEQNGNSGGAAPLWSTNSGGGLISFVGGGRWGTTPGAYPPTGDGGPANRYAAGTFVFEPVNIAYEVLDGTVGNQAFGGSLGMDFVTLKPLEVTQLGVFDSGQDGLAGTITAHLYDRSDTSAPLASLSFSGSDGTLIGGSRFLSLATPLSLPAGFEGTIVAEGYGAAEPNGNSASGWQIFNAQSAIGFVGSGRWGNAGQFPTNIDGGPVNRYAAGTFIFEAAPIPPSDASGPVLVPNGSFELPGRPQQPAGGYYGSNTFAWYPTVPAGAGDFHPADDLFTDPIPDGTHIAFVNSGALVSAPLDETLQPDTLYILDVDWGNRADGATPYHSINLRAGGVNLGWLNDSNMRKPPDGPVGPGQWESVRAYFTADHNAPLGAPLDIALTGANAQAVFDNVRLTKIVGAAVPVVNPSFEQDDVPAGGGWQIGATGWDPSPNPPNAGIFDGSANITPADGFQTAFIENGASLTQTLDGVTLENGRRYILLVDVADRSTTPFAGYQVELLAGGQTVATDLDSIGIIEYGPGQTSGPGFFWVTSVIDFETGPNHPLAGQQLGIRLSAPISAGHAYFDNVRLFAIGVPEPSTFVLAALALVGLVIFARRPGRR